MLTIFNISSLFISVLFFFIFDFNWWLGGLSVNFKQKIAGNNKKIGRFMVP